MSTSSEVVVVGAGLAGVTAALAAAERGATVTLLEKTGRPGGSTVLSGGFLALAGTEWQYAQGIEDSDDLLERDILDVGEHANDPDLVHAYAAGQRELTDWLVERGLRIEDLELSSGQSVARSHRCDPAALVASLAERARAAGVRLEFDAPVDALVVQDGAVRGVVLGERTIRADAVVLTSGGFSRSEELLSRWAPAQARALRVGGAGNTGDGLAMAMDVGADARDFEFVKGTFGAHPDATPERHELLLLYYLGAVIVNRAGHRYVDESISYKLLGDACLQQRDPVSFQVFDAGVLQSAPVGVPLFDPRPFLERGMVRVADSVSGLAEQMQVPADGLRATLDAYNAGVGSGNDPLGRHGLVHGNGTRVMLDRPPFYAFPSTSVVLATYCGLRVDASARVLDRDGSPILGLWAAGELTGGFHGAAYMTGTSLGKAAFFGRAAGRGAARREPTD